MATLDSVNTEDDNINDSISSANEKTTDDKEDPAEKEVENNHDVDEAENEKGNVISRIPLARIKKIMKADTSLGIMSQDAVFLIAKATEFFIESLVVESYQNMASGKRKTLSRRDVDSSVEGIDSLAFLDGAIDDE